VYCLLYLSVREQLENMIKEGVFQEGEKLPSEPLLSKQLNVSRSTLREAIKILQIQGFLDSRNGIGTYVKKYNEVFKSSLNILQSTEEMISHSGIQATQADMKVYKRKSLPEWQEKLKDSGKDVTIIERIRRSDDLDVAYTFNVFSQAISGNHFDEGLSGSLLHFLKDRLGIAIQYTHSEICMPRGENIFDEKAIHQLGEKTLLLKQLHFDASDNPIFYSYDYMDNTYVKFYIKREI